MRVFALAPPILLAAAVAVATPSVAAAQDDAETESYRAQELLANFWIRASLGVFNNADEPQLPGQRDHSGFLFGVGLDLPSAPWLGIDFEVISTSRKFDTEGGAFIIVVDDETSVESEAYTLAPRVSLPPQGPVRAYGTVGLAVVNTRFKTDATLFGLPGTAQEQSDTAVRPVVGAGLQVLFGQWAIHADYRRWSVSGSFPEYEIQDIALGGSTFTVGAGWSPGRGAGGS